MESRFGLKDFVLIVLIVGVGVIVLMSMQQRDRVFLELQQISENLKEQSNTMSALRRTLDQGVRFASPSLEEGGATRAPSPSARDESWARPGVGVTWPEPWGPVSDPRQFADFAMGGTLTEIFEGIPKKLTPYTLNDVYISRIVQENLCESLAMYASDDLRLQGWLAEAWQYDPDGMWLRVKIHDAARFSDGQPVTAEDVRFTYMDYVFNAELETQEYVTQMNAVTDVEVISDKVCEFTFAAPSFKNLWAAMRYPILPKHYFEQFTPSQINQSTGLVMGSGPWRFETIPTPETQWSPPEPVVLVRNPNYWRDPPPIDTMRFTFIQNITARLTAFENGAGDIMRSVSSQTDLKRQDPEWLEEHRAMAWSNLRSGYAIVAWNCGERNGRLTPFSDHRVRLAMTLLMDRWRVNRDFYEDLATVCDGPFPESQSNPDIEPWPYDADRAVELLTEAGWIDRNGDGRLENERGDPFTFEFIHTTGSSVGPKLGRYMKDQCSNVGIEMNIRIVDWSMLESIRDTRDFDSLIQAWSWTEPESDPYQLFHSSQIANQGDNWIQYANEEADRIMEEARKTVDLETRMALWHRLHEIFHAEQPYTFLLNPPWQRFITKRIQNVHPYMVGMNKWEMYIPLENQR